MNVQIGVGKSKWFNGDSDNAQAFYRLWPFAKLPGVTVHEEPIVSLSTLHKMDWIVLHQPMDPVILQYIAMAKKMGVKVWLDMDDLVISGAVPPSNPAAHFFRPKQVQDVLRLSLEAADVVSVTTPTLKAALVQWLRVDAAKIHVIPNALPDELWARRAQVPELDGNYKALWRGSITHMGDLLLLKDAFKDYDGLDFVFYGHEPWMLYERYGGKLTKVLLKDWKAGILNYLDDLAGEPFDFGFVCLENVPFNQAKSNISWLECTWAGAAFIAPRYMPEFNKACIACYGKADAPVGKHYAHDLAAVFKDVASGKVDRDSLHRVSVAEVEANYLLSVVNPVRGALLGVNNITN